MVGLDVTDDGFDRGSSLHLVFECGGGSADLAGDPDAVSVGVVMAAIAIVDMGAPELDADVVLDIGDGVGERVAVERAAVQRLGVEHELPSLGTCRRRRHRDFAAELIGRTGLALADAFHLDLLAALALVLEQHPDGERAQRSEALGQFVVARGLAPDIADQPAEPPAREPQLAVGALELVGMGIAPDHDRRPLGDLQIALPQRHSARLGECDDLDDRFVGQPGTGQMGDRLGLDGRIDHHTPKVIGRQHSGRVRNPQV
jgi:hypothetical protein